MKALDTNVLVRFLVGDDEAMMRRATRLLEDAESGGETCLITVPVLLELIWVLRARYEFSRGDIIESVEALWQVRGLSFDPACDIRTFLDTARRHSIDLADALIGVHAKHLGCEATVTFDRKAAKVPLFEKVPDS